MATHSIFGAAAPAGTAAKSNDAKTTIVGNAFDIAAGGPTNFSITGGRLYVASTVAAGLPSTVTMYLFQGQDLNPSLALRTATLTISGTGWQSVSWSTPVPMTPGVGYYVAYKMSTNDYLHFPSPGSTAIPSGTASAVRMAALVGDYNRSLYRYDSDPVPETFTAPSGILWATDIIVEDSATTPLTVDVGADRSVVMGGNTTLTAVPAGGAGSKTYAWTVVSGPSTASGQFSPTSSAATTFTPTAVGTYVLRCTVTDTSGTANDTLTVTVTAATVATGTVQTVNASTGWTPTGGTVLAALSDANASTYVTSAENPTNAVLDVTLQPLAPPASGQGFQVTLQALRYTGTASSATATVQIYNSSTLRATSSAIMITATATDTVFSFTSAQVASVDWAAVRVVVTVSAAA